MPVERSTPRRPAGSGRPARTFGLLLVLAAYSAIGGGAPASATCSPGQHDFYGTCIEQLSLFGQASWKETARGAVLGHTLGWHASGLAIDQSAKPSRIYVADTSNSRITVFAAEDIAAAQGMFPNLSATRVFGGTATTPGPCDFSPVAVTFDSANRMVVANDGGVFTSDYRTRSVRQLFLFPTPFTSQVPSATIRVPMGAPGEIQFDEDDNLVIRDHTWHRAWVVNLARDPAWVVPE